MLLRQSRSGLIFLSIVFTVGVSSGPLRAAELTVQNDSFVSGTANIFADFVAGEEAAAWLTSPCDGDIVAVQIGWNWDQQSFPQPPATLEENIFIYNGGTFPNPGVVLETLVGPLLTAGFVNEYRFLDEDMLVPLIVPVTQGQVFVVSLEFANATDVTNGSAAVFADTDGCGLGLSGIFAGVWFDLCPLLMAPGDIVIRAVVDCDEGPGACCESSLACANDVEEQNCQGAGQTFFGGQTCLQVTCPEPAGACCNQAGGCLENVTQSSCEGLPGAVFAGEGTVCGSGVCDNGACCVGESCFADQTSAGCDGFGGDWQGPLSTCTPIDPCAPECDLADLDCNGAVNLADFATFARCFGQPVSSPPPSCSTAEAEVSDLNDDTNVNLQDFAIFAGEFGT